MSNASNSLRIIDYLAIKHSAPTLIEQTKEQTWFDENLKAQLKKKIQFKETELSKFDVQINQGGDIYERVI